MTVGAGNEDLLNLLPTVSQTVETDNTFDRLVASVKVMVQAGP